MMDSVQIIRFLELLGVDRITHDRERGWVRSSCPLAKWMHESGKDRKPSFGIKIPEEGKAPYFYCFACGSTGPLPKLLHNLIGLSKDRLADASNFLSQFPLFEDKQETSPRGGRRIRITDKYASAAFSDREVLTNESVPQESLAQYPLLAEKCSLTAHAEALKWLVYTRKISLQSIAKFKLRLYVAPVLEDVGVIFPILSRDGEQVLDMWVRLIDQKRFFRLSKDFTGGSVDYKAPNLWFGNHMLTTEKPVVLVEGGIDVLRLDSFGVQNVLGSFGMPSREQIESIYAPVVYLGYDNDGVDGAGTRTTKKLVDTLQVPSISILDWGVAGRKDAGELESVAEFRAVFDARIKILKSVTKPPRRIKPKIDPTASLLRSKRDDSFL